MPCDLEVFENEHNNDYHAGWVETSSLLAMDKDYVRDGYKDLPDSVITDRDMISTEKQLSAMANTGISVLPAWRHRSWAGS